MLKWLGASSLSILLLLSGCARPPAEETSDAKAVASPETSQEAKVNTKQTTSISRGRGMQRLVALAKADLGARLAVDGERIEVLEADYVTWRDSSAGCPQPGYEYTQALVNGARIKLRAAEKTYFYHSGGKRPPFLCENPSPIDPLPYAPGEA